MYAYCPVCLTGHHHSRLIPSNELMLELEKEYTIVCAVCRTIFHVKFVAQSRRFFGLIRGCIQVRSTD